MSAFADVLARRRDEIVRTYTERIGAELAPGPRTDSELRDHLPDYLDEMAVAIRGAARPSPALRKQDSIAGENLVAKAHGQQRYRVGFSLEALVAEHGVLRSLILDAIEKAHCTIELADVRAFTDFVSEGVADAVTSYTVQRGEAVHAAEEAGRERDAWLRALVDNSTDFIGLANVAGEAVYLNPAGRRMIGLEGPLAGIHLLDCYAPEGRAQAEREIVPRILEDGYWAGETVFRHFVTEERVPVSDTHFAIREPMTARLLGYGAICRDIRELKQAEAERAVLLARASTALAEAEEERQRLQRVFAQAPIAICILEGPEHTFTLANPAARALLADRELVGKPIFEALPELKEQGLDTLLDQVLATGTPYFGKEIAGILPDHGTQETGFFNLIFQPKRAPNGEVDGVLASFVDVSEHVRARRRLETASEALRTSEERLRRLMDVTAAGGWELDITGGTVRADASLRALHAFPEEGDFALARAFATIHEHDRARVETAVAGALAGRDGGQYKSEYRVQAADGRVRWLEARGQAYFDAAGKAVRFLGTGVDITARKTAELAREGILEALAAQSSLLVCVVKGPDLVYEMANPYYVAQVAGGRAIVGVPMAEAASDLVDAGRLALLRQVLDTGTPIVADESPLWLGRPETAPEQRFFNFVYQPVRGAEGDFDSVLVLSHEVTGVVRARHMAERLAAEEKERLEFEQQLIGIVSHDLRTPLGAVLVGTGVLLRREELDERSSKIVTRIQSSAERAARLVKDLLDFTQARLGGGLPVVLAPTNLHVLTRQVVEEVRANFPDRMLILEARGDGSGEWDAERIAQVVTNLTSNALKYGVPHAPVTVCTAGEGAWAELTVHNEGDPIPPPALARLFQPLQRATTLSDTLGRSVGLGLYIVKHIVEAHGGTIEVVSESSAGTTFRVRIPRRRGLP